MKGSSTPISWGWRFCRDSAIALMMTRRSAVQRNIIRWLKTFLMDLCRHLINNRTRRRGGGAINMSFDLGKMISMTPMTRRNGVKLNYYLTTGFCSYKIFELLSTFSKKITFKVCFLNCFRHSQKKITFKVCFCWHKEKNA